MSKPPSRQQNLEFGDFAREVVDVPVADEMSESFLAYSLSVITSRAIPDIRDGLKPVQRRILYSMLQMGLRPENPHKKSARVVGDTMGKYHPHGDAAIYDTMARMGQDFRRMITMVDPQGNFGSLDDPPAAARYTECRLTQAAMDMAREIDEDTVEFRSTYDGEGDEPVYLPALVPNLMVNGTTGIAVGMATNMPTHNLVEVAKAIELVMKQRRPKPTTEQLMAVIPGPDFPSGGTIVDEAGEDGENGLATIVETGKGTFRVRAKAEIDQLSKSRQGIVITELPYQVGPERVIAKVLELVRNDKIRGIDANHIVNLSDHKSGLRLEIGCKPGVHPQAVLNDLFRLTPLEETFGVNNLVLVDGVPTTLGMYDMCRHYIDHRLDVIVRRTQYRLNKAQARLHIVLGLLIALDNIDDVITIIRRSADSAEAKERLMMALELSEVQATHILDMQLRRLTALERQKLVDERDSLATDIADYEAILKSEARRRTIVVKELNEISDAYGKPRRTRIVTVDEIPVYEVIEVVDDSIADEACVVTLSTSGQVGQVPAEGAKRAKNGRHDLVVSRALTSTRSPVYAITSEGRSLEALAFELGDAEGRSRGAAASQVFGTNKGEDILHLFVPGTENLVLVTEQGMAKRLSPDEVAGTKGGKTLVKLKPGDRIAAAFAAPDGVDVVIVASDGQALRTSVDAISVQGRGAGGVAGMKLKDEAKVVGAGSTLGDGDICIVTAGGAGKATPLSELDTKGRGGAGVRLTKIGDDTVSGVALSEADQLLVLMAADDSDTKIDPNPVPFPFEATKRDLTMASAERPILQLGWGRW